LVLSIASCAQFRPSSEGGGRGTPTSSSTKYPIGGELQRSRQFLSRELISPAHRWASFAFEQQHDDVRVMHSLPRSLNVLRLSTAAGRIRYGTCPVTVGLLRARDVDFYAHLQQTRDVMSEE
jgi:hypothetical protein